MARRQCPRGVPGLAGEGAGEGGVKEHSPPLWSPVFIFGTGENRPVAALKPSLLSPSLILASCASSTSSPSVPFLPP